MVALIFLSVVAAVFVTVVALEGGDPALERRPRGSAHLDRERQLARENRRGSHGRRRGRAAALRRHQLRRSSRASSSASASPRRQRSATARSSPRAIPQRRAISLALGGAAFGVAYLTAYSAFALFGYLPTMQGLGLLVLTAVGAGVFAVSRSALSLAVLSMVGAFMAPAFAVEDPGPGVVYGYYVAISALTLAMVAVRGWRPLIHLSFLFTLAGSAFFAWTAGYFRPGEFRGDVSAAGDAGGGARGHADLRAALGTRRRGRVARHHLSTGAAGGRGADRARHRAVARGAGDAILVVRGHLAGRLGCGCSRSAARVWRATPSSVC